MKEQLCLDNQLCFPLYACARKVTGLYTPFFKPLGITYTQYIVFLALWEKDDVSVSDLCARLYLDSGTLTPLLKKMEQDGYIKRTRSASDERIVRITLTEKGREMEERAADIPMQVGSCITLDPEEAVTLYALLSKILAKENSHE
ncbi:MAG: MarR family transcriptional regulator [Solobacterium sp.]|nr:MarR family transcriptional regulator [Solobacterium sp.]